MVKVNIDKFFGWWRSWISVALLAGFLVAQPVRNKSCFSDKKLDIMVAAISRAEGAGVVGSKPNCLHNPGALRKSGRYEKFHTDAEGRAALRHQLLLIAQGRSRVYSLDMSLQQMGKRYASDPQWAEHVAKILHVSVATPLQCILCDKEL
jgi:hypothetical protein